MGGTYYVERVITDGLPYDRWKIVNQLTGKAVMMFGSDERLEAENLCALLNMAYDAGFASGLSAKEDR
jgi:hypothetical protein